MRYTLLAIAIGIVVLWALTMVSIAVRRKVLLPRREARRQRARDRATWRCQDIRKDGKTQLIVRKIANDGNWSEVMDQEFVGQIDQDRADYEVQLDGLWAKALARVYQLNTGPLM